MERKFMLCQYPKNGFGEKCGKYYLLDVYGNKYDIKNEYDKVLDEMELVVKINDSPFGIFHGKTMKDLIETIELNLDTKIEEW